MRPGMQRLTVDPKVGWTVASVSSGWHFQSAVRQLAAEESSLLSFRSNGRRLPPFGGRRPFLLRV